MRNLDETDIEILQLLAEDGRRAYSEIAEAVDLSPPAVSDRVERLRESGVIRRFTVDVDRSQLRESFPVLVSLRVHPEAIDQVRETLSAAPPVEHVFTTANSRIVFHANAPPDVREWLLSSLDFDVVEDYTIEPLSAVDWQVTVEGSEFALSCAECGNTVDEEGISARIGGELKQFCCSSCEANYRERYEELAEGA
jgi:DNA-binding Lrp family transcriptional regulator